MCFYRNVYLNPQKSYILINNEVCQQILTSNSRYTWSAKKTDISENWMDIEQDMPGDVQQSKGLNQEGYKHGILQLERPL